MKHLHSRTRISLAILALGLPSFGAHAQLVISDTLTGGHASHTWRSLNGACLTAGDGTGSIPACVGLPYYAGKTLVGGTTGRLPDAVGSGALRLTNGDTADGGSNGDNQTGAVVSDFTFPTNEGLLVTWTSVTYGGDNLNSTGADGISFFLSDGSADPSVGALGGSLGYSCSNVNGTFDGVVKAYIGIGIDEYGNFSNHTDNTSTGDAVPGLHPGRISVRGSGDTTAAELHNAYPSYYNLSYTGADAVHNTCKTGHIWNYSGAAIGSIDEGQDTGVSLDSKNYPLISTSDLPASVHLANQEATDPAIRANAIPITYQLKITSDGYMTFSYAVNGGATTTVIANQPITESNGPLPASFRFGFSSGTGGGNNVHEITCFKAAPSDVSGSSAGSNVQSAQVTGDTQVFLAYYQPVNWWGSLTANGLQIVTTGGLQELTNSSVANWDANCGLTGGSCASMTPAGGSTPSISKILPNDRVILTSDGSGAGVAFRNTSLSTAQKNALKGTGSDSTTSSNRVSYLRGNRSLEVANGGSLRTRTGVLGDIVDSSPTWVAYPNSNYAGLTKDKLHTATSVTDGSSYATFQSDNYSRTSVVYVGSNDGMVHGFEAGSYTAPGTGSTQPTFNSAGNDGKEVLAFMPAQVLMAIHNGSDDNLDFSSTHYVHNFYVDATPGSGDLYYNGAWHTWLVGGLGVGGHPDGAVADTTSTFTVPVSSLYALDITDPGQFQEAHAATLVIGDWSSSTISCTVATGSCGDYMGQTLGTPLIRRLHDGTWGVIWGNGTNSTNGHSGLFIMHVNIADGSKTFQYIDAGAGPAGGIAQVAAADLDGDHITDYVYGGDTLGRLWRFDLTSSSSSSWSALKLFQTPNSTTGTGGVPQPITAAPVVASVSASNSSGKPKLLVYFGTGEKLPVTIAAGESYASGTQSIYGIWDASMTAWNSSSTDTKYAALSSPTLPVPVSKLQSQTVTGVTSLGTDSYSATIQGRTVSSNIVCWADGTSSSPGSCASFDQMGAKLDLPTTNEQIIYNPSASNGYALFNTTIPQVAGILTCDNTTAKGWSMALNLTNGGQGSNPALLDGYSGVSLSGTGTPNMYVTNSSQAWLATETVDGLFKGVHLTGAVGSGSRLTWTKIR